jgi:hypothetical protein
MARDFDAFAQMQPPSPTLTNPDMILPFGSFGPPSPPRKEQPPLLLANVRDLDLTSYGLGSGKRARNLSTRTPPPSNSRQSTALSDIAEIDTTPKKLSRVVDTVASSPTLRDYGNTSRLSDWRAGSNRRMSDSSSVQSEDLENLKWPGFDSHGGMDTESEMSEQEEERFGSFPKDPGSDDNVDEGVNDETDDHWLGSRPDDDDEDDDPLSRRADLILANAKKRLNVRCSRRCWNSKPTDRTIVT